MHLATPSLFPHSGVWNLDCCGTSIAACIDNLELQMMEEQILFVPAFVESRGSAIREMAKWAADPAFISFAGGYPAADAFDVEGIQRAAEAAWKQGAGECLQYGSTEGVPLLRQALKDLSSIRGILAHDDQLLVTTGSQQGLDFLLRATVSPGDMVLVERPTYPGALQAFKLAGARVVGIEADAEGLDPGAVEEAIRNADAVPKLIYVVSTFANPTGRTMSDGRRQELLQLAARHRILLVEDDPYGALRFSGEAPPPIAAYAAADPDLQRYSVYLSTLSKIAVPSLRIGWMIAAPDVARRCVMAKQVSDMCTSPWLQNIAAAYLTGPDFRVHVPRIIGIYEQRATAMAKAIRREFGNDWSFQEPDGGMFLWVKLPKSVDTSELLRYALKEKVLFVPGVACYASQPNTATMRLSYSTCDPDVIAEGMSRLRLAYKTYLSEKRTELAAVALDI